jgi:hypothetical protein
MRGMLTFEAWLGALSVGLAGALVGRRQGAIRPVTVACGAVAAQERRAMPEALIGAGHRFSVLSAEHRPALM